MELQKLLRDVSLNYKIIRCDTEHLVRQSKELRHFIYCSEKGWEPENTLRIEEDIFDELSIHYLVLFRESKQFIGTFRLIVSNDLPLNKYMPSDNIFHPKNAPIDSVCEVSRFSIIKSYRGLALLHALFLLVGYESSKKGFVGAYMVMERGLAIQLRRNKINCRQITKRFLLNGNRAIYFCSSVECLNALGITHGFNKKQIDELFLPLYEKSLSKAS